MSLFKVVCGEIIACVGTYQACEECLEWLESEGANGAEIRIEKC